LPLVCQNCGSNAFNLRWVGRGADAQCVKCNAIIPNAALQPVGAISASHDKGNQIQLAAQEMIRLHGTDAARQAARRAGDALSMGALDETNMWLAVIGTLVSTKDDGG
jgi:hypothetical protein